MLIKSRQYTPGLSFWSCDEYPYYLAAIKSIQRIVAPIETNIINTTPHDELHIVLKGKACYNLQSIDEKSNFFDIAKNDILFMPSGMQKYLITEASDDFELIIIKFTMFTCPGVSTQADAFNFSELLTEPIQNRRMMLYLPTVTHFNNGDEIHNHITTILEEARLQQTGYTIAVQTHFLQLVLEILKKLDQKYAIILENVGFIGITSKYSPYTAFRKSSVLTISDIEIFDNNPHVKSTNAKVLNTFLAKRSEKLNPQNNNLLLNNYFDNRINSEVVELSAVENTMYHVWLSSVGTPENIRDLRPYADTAYLRFYAKCNTRMRFGMVVYNHKTNRGIINTFNIAPSKDFVEYCVPITGGNPTAKANPHIRKVMAYIETHYEEKILLQDIAKYTHLNTTYLSSLFKEQTGQSISDYILDYRLSVAKNLLVDLPDAPISDIALSSGFYDTAHFSKAFKKQYGVTAREYRNGQKALNKATNVTK